MNSKSTDAVRKFSDADADVDAVKAIPSPTFSTKSQKFDDVKSTRQKFDDIHILATGIFHAETRAETEIDLTSGGGFEMTSLNMQREVLTMSIRSEHCRVLNGCLQTKGGKLVIEPTVKQDPSKETTLLTYNWIRGSNPACPQKFEEFFFKCEVEHLV
jgi:hypothetical protein